MSNPLKDRWDRVKDAVVSWFRRCNGPDSLGLALIIAALVVMVLGRVTGLSLLGLPATALYLWAIFRMFSHNKARRMEENRRYLEGRAKLKTEFSQALNRLKNIRTYKYYRCPNCKARLRMPRGIGEKTVTCSQCRHQFRQKA